VQDRGLVRAFSYIAAVLKNGRAGETAGVSLIRFRRATGMLSLHRRSRLALPCQLLPGSLAGYELRSIDVPRSGHGAS
jgi:hypothetical protein